MFGKKEKSKGIVKAESKTKTMNNEQVNLDKAIKDYLFGSGTNLSESQKALFIQTAKAFNLNPIKREVYAITYWNKRTEKYDMSIITGYQVYLQRAEKSGKLDGWKSWYDSNEKKAYIRIHRKDWSKPFEYSVKMSEFNTGKSLWLSKPEAMILKVVEATGFRKAFPEELGGVPYTADELPEDMSGREVKNITPEPKKIEQKKEEPKQIKKPKEEIKNKDQYTLPKDITPNTICDIGSYKGKNTKFEDIPLEKLLILRKKAENPIELEGVLKYVLDKYIEGIEYEGLELLMKTNFKKEHLIDLTVDERIKLFKTITNIKKKGVGNER